MEEEENLICLATGWIGEDGWRCHINACNNSETFSDDMDEKPETAWRSIRVGVFFRGNGEL